MRKFLFTIIAFFLLIAPVFSQTTNSSDEKIRKKLAVDYLEVLLFEYETPQGEAVANLLIKAFKENLAIAPIDQKIVANENDKIKISAVEFALKKLASDSAPTWDQLVEAEKNFLILKDKQVSRHSKYK